VKGLWIAALTLLVSAPAAAGELVFANGSRIDGELSNESLMVSTGSGLLELAPDDVASLSREEIQLRDGRVIRGTLVGGHLKARTALGEIAVKVDELQSYRAGPKAQESASAPASAAPSQPAGPASPTAGAAPASTGISGGLPTVAAYQDSAARRGSGSAAPPGVKPSALTRESPSASSRVLEVVGTSVLYRDALASSSQVGRVSVGQQVRYVDSIDRRLRILNLLVFDGGHWVKVRAADGTEGWVSAENVREVQ
jgi:Bacterial SH3 domain